MITWHLRRGLAKLGSVDLFFLDSRTEGPAIVCLHGRCGRAETWSDLIRRYGDDFRIIAPDQRGHGLSGRPRSAYSDVELASDVVELMTHLGIVSAIIVGHSMGGAVAAYVAALHPQRVAAVAILDKSAAGPGSPMSIESSREHDPTRDWPLPFPSRRSASEHIRRIARSELEHRYFMSSLTETVAGYEMMFSSDAIARGIGQYVSWFRLLPALSCPVLLLRAGSHAAVPDEDWVRMQELISDCTAREVAHPDHNVHLADKRQFYAHLDEFLAHVGTHRRTARRAGAQ